MTEQPDRWTAFEAAGYAAVAAEARAREWTGRYSKPISKSAKEEFALLATATQALIAEVSEELTGLGGVPEIDLTKALVDSLNPKSLTEALKAVGAAGRAYGKLDAIHATATAHHLLGGPITEEEFLCSRQLLQDALQALLRALRGVVGVCQ